MKHLQTKSDLMCDLEHAIGTKDAFMESLGKQSRRVSSIFMVLLIVEYLT